MSRTPVEDGGKLAFLTKFVKENLKDHYPFPKPKKGSMDTLETDPMFYREGRPLKKELGEVGARDRERDPAKYQRTANLMLDYFVFRGIDRIFENITSSAEDSYLVRAKKVDDELNRLNMNAMAYYLDPKGFMPSIIDSHELFQRMELIHGFINEFLKAVDTLDLGFATKMLLKNALETRRDHLEVQLSRYRGEHPGHGAKI